MGHMKLEMFKLIVDQAENNIEFISLASRGEPLLAPVIEKMWEYTRGKFLSLKINTNASVLTEKKCHAIFKNIMKFEMIDKTKNKNKIEILINTKVSVLHKVFQYVIRILI